MKIAIGCDEAAFSMKEKVKAVSYTHLGEVNPDVRRKAIGDQEVITCRPADLLQPELEKYAEELGDMAKQEEDVLTYALFPQVAKKFFENRDKGEQTENEVRRLFVQDVSR